MSGDRTSRRTPPYPSLQRPFKFRPGGVRKTESTCVSTNQNFRFLRFFRFVPTDAAWRWTGDINSIQREIGTCLRLIECDDTTPRVFAAALEEAAFDLWEVAREDVWQSWTRETDPANLQPKVRPLNQRVAEFIRANRPPNDPSDNINRALDILEAPWPRREEILLRDWFADASAAGAEKARRIVTNVLETGLEPFNQPPLLPPIEKEDVRLLCWLGIATTEMALN